MGSTQRKGAFSLSSALCILICFLEQSWIHCFSQGQPGLALGGLALLLDRPRSRCPRSRGIGTPLPLPGGTHVQGTVGIFQNRTECLPPPGPGLCRWLGSPLQQAGGSPSETQEILEDRKADEKATVPGPDLSSCFSLLKMQQINQPDDMDQGVEIQVLPCDTKGGYKTGEAQGQRGEAAAQERPRVCLGPGQAAWVAGT